MINWREPWRNSKVIQRRMLAMAGGLGMLLVSPLWLACWDHGFAVLARAQTIQQQQDMTASLQRDTEQIQRDMTTHALPEIGVQALIALAPLNTLQILRTSQQAQTSTDSLRAMHLQLMPMRFETQGSWLGWLHWLEQWPRGAPGVTLSSLTLKSNSQGEISVQMAVLATQLDAAGVGKGATLATADDGIPFKGAPFDGVRWSQTKREYAQSHPSFTQHMAPEPGRGPEPLEHFSRTHLHYVGHISKGQELHALIRVHDPVDRSVGSKLTQVHRVHVGSRMGQNFGRVLAIGPTHLSLVEFVPSMEGHWQRQDVQMPLQERQP